AIGEAKTNITLLNNDIKQLTEQKQTLLIQNNSLLNNIQELKDVNIKLKENFQKYEQNRSKSTLYINDTHDNEEIYEDKQDDNEFNQEYNENNKKEKQNASKSKNLETPKNTQSEIAVQTKIESKKEMNLYS